MFSFLTKLFGKKKRRPSTHQKDYEEIAHKYGVSPNYVRNLAHTCKKKKSLDGDILHELSARKIVSR